jgi:hypothetical protein
MVLGRKRDRRCLMKFAPDGLSEQSISCSLYILALLIFGLSVRVMAGYWDLSE